MGQGLESTKMSLSPIQQNIGPVTTVMGDRFGIQLPVQETYLNIITSHPGQLSLAIPLWGGTMSTSQRVVMLCGWGVKARMVRVWVAGKTV